MIGFQGPHGPWWVKGKALAFLLLIAAGPLQGGHMTIAFRDDMATLDPAIGYDNNNWPIIRSIFNGLLDYVPGTTTLRPMLAASYTVSPDSLTYTFKLRPGRSGRRRRGGA